MNVGSSLARLGRVPAGPVGEGGAAGGPRSVLDPPSPMPPAEAAKRQTCDMPELPEVEITARRLNTALAGARSNRPLAPGMNVMKTFEPALDELAGREVSRGATDREDAGCRVRGSGSADPSDVRGAAAALRQARLGQRPGLPRAGAAEDGRELRLREFGTKQRAWAKLLPRPRPSEDGDGRQPWSGSLAPAPARGNSQR